MNNNCVCCGLPIPDGQNTCSMCYGDVDHGKDGYYAQWLEEQYLEDLDLSEAEKEASRDDLDES